MSTSPVRSPDVASPSPSPASDARAGAAPRWHRHGWNRPLAWELILRITPRLPRFVLVPLHHVTSLMCFAVMRRERTCARRNLRRVTGATGLANLRLAYRLFLNYSRFMVAYAGMRGSDAGRLRERLIGVEETRSTIRSILEAGDGAIIATMHIGQWDLGLKLFGAQGVPIHVVMLSEDPVEVTRYADEARANPALTVHRAGGSSLLAVELMAALRRGECVAIQVDRPVGKGVMKVDFFGAPADLPTGPAQLAMAAGAPIVPVFVLLDGGDRFRLLTLPPMRFERARGALAEAALRDAMRRMVEMMESVVSRHPDQWFNFYDVWATQEEQGVSPSSALAGLRHLLFQRHAEPARLAAAVALGVFVGMTPFFGVQTLLAVALAGLLRVNIAAAVLASQISNPLLAPLVIGASVWVGDRLGAPSASGAAWYDPRDPAFYESWLRGGLVLGLALGAVCGAVTWAVAARVRRRRHA